MVHHITLMEAQTDVTGEILENIMVETRIRLLKIPEISNLRVGKRIDVKGNPYTLFYSFDVENMDKLRIVHDNAVFAQYQTKALSKPIMRQTHFNYEMEPGKDIRYS